MCLGLRTVVSFFLSKSLLVFSSVEFVLLRGSLEFTVSKLGGCVDELEVDLLSSSSGSSVVDLMSEDQWSRLVSDATSLDHDVVVVDDTIVWESSHWGNVLFSQIVFGRGVILNSFRGSLSCGSKK